MLSPLPLKTYTCDSLRRDLSHCLDESRVVLVDKWPAREVSIVCLWCHPCGEGVELVELRLGAGTFSYTLKLVLSTMYCLAYQNQAAKCSFYAGFGIWKWKRQRTESNFKSSLGHKSENPSQRTTEHLLQMLA